ncbi:NAD(+)/NADH kinase [Armatimonas sp.]|uniref:NAD(+)/NADH kinase n=1 Tax=Armatimonas sp. TaxID=1872638 RepID=UPI0037530D23
MSGKIVGLLANDSKPAALEAAMGLAKVLIQRGVAVRMPPDYTDDEIAKSDFVVVFGGDGTVLSAARLVAAHGTPLLAIHLGRFGFVTEAAPENLEAAVTAALQGHCEVHERMLLAGALYRGDDPMPETHLLAMNDVVVASGAVRMVHVHTRVGEHAIATYAADGVIVSSPTGSTGYSLSAGGPLVHPDVRTLMITPIAPHTLSARTLLVPDTETIYLTIEAQTRDAVAVTADGQTGLSLSPGDTVAVSRAPYNVRLLAAGGPNFYQKIRSRWHYAERLSG